MKKLITLSYLLLTTAISGFAQQVKLNKDTTRSMTAPLYIFKQYASDTEYNALPILALIDQRDIASMEILKDKTANELYGNEGKYGVIIITLIKDVEVHSVDELLNQYKIKPKFKKLPLFVDYNLIRTSKDMFYSNKGTNVKSITIEKEKETGMKYISIITTNYNPNPVPVVEEQMHLKGGSSGE